MGKVKWGGGLSGGDFDNADRNQFSPYDGPPVPTNTLFCWKVKILKRGKSTGGHDQLIVGLELTPRRSRPDEKPYAGFYTTDYIIVREDTLFRVAPFLDAIGVSGADFAERTDVEREADSRGSRSILKIGRWVNNGKNYVMATLVDSDDGKGNPRKKIGSYWPIPEESSKVEETVELDDEGDTELDEEEETTPKKKASKRRAEPEPDDDEGEDDSEDSSDDEDDEPVPPRKSAKKAAPAKKATKKSPRLFADDNEDDEGEPPF